MYHEKLDVAATGDSVNVIVDVPKQDMRCGMVASAADDCPARECSSFLAQVIVLSSQSKTLKGEIGAGCVLWVECHTAQVPCLFEELLYRSDRRTGQVLELQPTALRAGDAAVVRLRPQGPVCVEPFSENPPLGRFAIRDQKVTVAVGVVQQVDYVAGVAWNHPAKAAGSRSKPSKQPSQSGRSTRVAAKPVRLGGAVHNLDAVADAVGAFAVGDVNRTSVSNGGISCVARGACDLAPTVGVPSPFAAFRAVAKPSTHDAFGAFGAVTKRKAKEPTRPSRAVRADSCDDADDSSPDR